MEQLWYPLSKTLAEKAAWDFAKENDLDVVVVNPGTVMGPVIPPRLNASMVMLVRLLQGNDRWLINCFFFFANITAEVSLMLMGIFNCCVNQGSPKNQSIQEPPARRVKSRLHDFFSHVKRGRERPRKTSKEIIKRDLMMNSIIRI